LFQMMGGFSEFERSMIVERTKAGMARAKAQGKAIGRPVRIGSPSTQGARWEALRRSPCHSPDRIASPGSHQGL
jgi:DNA invertase Pin-like site-specific DNA recombinase